MEKVAENEKEEEEMGREVKEEDEETEEGCSLSTLPTFPSQLEKLKEDVPVGSFQGIWVHRAKWTPPPSPTPPTEKEPMPR